MPVLDFQVTGVDIPHDFPHDYQPVFGMDVRSCIEYYKHSLGRWGVLSTFLPHSVRWQRCAAVKGQAL